MEILERPLSQKEINEVAKIMLTKDNKMHYQMYDKGQYELYCPFCQTYKRVNYQQLKQIRFNEQCPTCLMPFKRFSKETNYLVEDYVKIDDYGYRFKVEWNFGELPHVLETEQCMYFDKSKTYVKDIRLKMFGRGIVKVDDEDYISHQYRVSNSEYYLYSTFKYPNPTLPLWLGNQKQIKKLALENNIAKSTISKLKSNQKKLIIDNDVTRIQVETMVVFDLNDIDDVYKHSEYIKKNAIHLYDFLHNNIKLNHFYLDYLDNNKNDLGYYFHFLQNLKELGFKYEKPKDFAHRSGVVQDLYNQHEQEIKSKKIEKRCEKLPTYKSKDIIISPFKTAQQIIDCGKALHNCIGGYVSRFADGETDLYHLDVKDKLTIAIEVRNNELWQAYADGNTDCPTKLMKHIKEFCKANNFDLGTYA